jgi:hypothetical protein
MKKILIIAVVAVFALNAAPSTSSGADMGYAGATADSGNIFSDGIIGSAYKYIFGKSSSNKKETANEKYLEMLKAKIVEIYAREGKTIIVRSFHEENMINQNARLLSFFVRIDAGEETLLSVLLVRKPDGLYYPRINMTWDGIGEYNNRTKKELAEKAASWGYNIGPAEDIPLGGLAYKKQPQPDKSDQTVQTTETPGAQPAQPQAPSAGRSVSETLAELKKMKDQGLITPDEYDAKKAEILRKM